MTRRRIAFVLLALAALLALAITRAWWLPPLLAALGDNATLVMVIVAILGLLVAAVAALPPLLGVHRPAPQPPGRLVQPVTLDALRAQFQDLQKQTFAYVDRGAFSRHLLAPTRLVITGDPKVGKTREAVELIGRVLEPRRILPARIFQPTTELRGTNANAVASQIRKDVGDHGPLLLFVDDLPRFFQANELGRLLAALNGLTRCGELHVVATARDDQLTSAHRAWLSAQGFEAISLSRWEPSDIVKLVDDGLYLVELPADSEGRVALVKGNDGTPELTRLTLLALAELGRSDRQTVEETQRDTYLDMWRKTRRELIVQQPAVEPLLRTAAVFYAARVTPYTILVMALAARQMTGTWRVRRLRAALRLLERSGLGQEDGRPRIRDYVAEVEGIDVASARHELAGFLLHYRRWLRFPGLRRLHQGHVWHADVLFELALAAEERDQTEIALDYYSAAIGWRSFFGYYNNRGLLHANHNRVAEALADYNEAIRLNPSLAMAFTNRGNLYADTGREAEALADYDKAMRLDSNDALALYNRGNLHADHNREAEALADFSEAIRLNPNFAMAFNNRGSLHADNGQESEALADFSEAIRLDPNLAQAFNNRGVLHNTYGRGIEALVDFSEAIRLDSYFAKAFCNRGLLHLDHAREAEALADYDEAIRVAPNDAAAFYHRGRLHAGAGRLDAALADYDEAIRLDPSYATAYYGRAFLHADAGHPDAALADYDETIRLDPDNAQAFHNRGLLHAGQGRPAEALADYDAAIRLVPDAQAYYNRGVLHANQGRPAEALADYDAAIRLNPDEAAAYNNRGALHADQGRPAEALADYDAAIRLNPDDATAYNNRGLLHDDQGRPAEALADYNEAIRFAPDFDDAYNNRGTLHASQDRLVEALADFNEAIRLNPDDAAAYYNRGTLLRELGRLEEATRDFEERLRLGQNTAGLHLNLAGVYRDLSRADDAARHLALAREHLPADDLYNHACLEAIANNNNLALDLLEQALVEGKANPAWVRRDPDWLPLRDDPRFRRLLGDET